VSFKNRIIATLVAAVLVAVLGQIDNASATSKQKLTYEEAYQKCKAIMDKEGTPGTSTQANVRHTRGAACMKKYGHKL
jgi:hypothetical protein